MLLRSQNSFEPAIQIIISIAVNHDAIMHARIFGVMFDEFPHHPKGTLPPFGVRHLAALVRDLEDQGSRGLLRPDAPVPSLYGSTGADETLGKIGHLGRAQF